MKVAFKKKIPVANTSIGEEEARAAYDVIKSGWLSMGKKVQEFEERFADYVGAKEAIAVNNGTAALHVALAALGIGEGDEVILPSLTFISTANVVLYQKATPVLAECDLLTYNMTAEELERRITPKTKAIIPVDMNGMPIDYDAILEVAERHKIPVIADSAESLGASYKGRKIGSIAEINCFSFFPNKSLTTGEGGMITTSNTELAKLMRSLRHQGQEGRYNHVVLGYNYRMAEPQAAIGIEQLKRVDDVVSSKQALAEHYGELFAGSEVVKAPFLPEYATQHSWYMYTVSVDQGKRDGLVDFLAENNIETRLSFPPIHNQALYQNMFGYKQDDYPDTWKAWSSLVNIPIWKGLDREVQGEIARVIQDCLS